MHTFAAAGTAFLLAVLWFDLMFDVQTRKAADDPLPPEVLASISAYYRRVTTEAYPIDFARALARKRTLREIESHHARCVNRVRLLPGGRRNDSSSNSDLSPSRAHLRSCREHGQYHFFFARRAAKADAPGPRNPKISIL
jgi:hypothetical protein